MTNVQHSQIKGDPQVVMLFKLAKMQSTATRCPLHGNAIWLASVEVSVVMSMCPSSTAHRVPMADWYQFTISASSSSDMSSSGQYSVDMGVSECVRSFMLHSAGDSSTFFMASWM